MTEWAETRRAGGRREGGDTPGLRRVVMYAAGLALGPAVALGLARFAYSLLLPAMRADLDWSYTQAGLMNTANAVGYLAGAVVCAAVVRRLGERATFTTGMIVTTVALLAAAVVSEFAGQLLLRLAAGIGSALTFIGGAALVAALGGHAPHRSGLLLGVYTAGAGAGIAVSGLTVQPLLGALGPGGWRWSWVVLAVISSMSLLATVPALRRVAEPASAFETGGRALGGILASLRDLRLPAAGYLLFGAGYIAYMTFIVAYLRNEGFSSGSVTAFWTVLGLAAVVGVPAWGRALDRLRSGHALAAMNAVLVGASLLALLVSGAAAGLGSAVLFGGCFLAIPAATAHLARRRLPPARWTAAIGGLTFAFALGQCIGPGLAGALADTSGGTAVGLVIAAVLLAAAALVNVALEHRRAGWRSGRANRPRS